MGFATQGRSSHWDSSGFEHTAVRTVTERVSADGEFKNGDRVFHDKFGNGVIIHIDGHKLDINFDAAGEKGDGLALYLRFKNMGMTQTDDKIIGVLAVRAFWGTRLSMIWRGQAFASK